MPSTLTPSTPARRTRSARLVAWRPIATPLGPFVLAVDDLGRLRTGWQRADWPAEDPSPARARERLRRDLLERVAARLTRYFAGEPERFDDLPLPDGTPFQQACWREARRMGFGETCSYGELAERAGAPGGARAAGQAMRRNPMPIIVPCHRVLASDGRLHGFAGSDDPEGIELGQKRWLLALESRLTSARGEAGPPPGRVAATPRSSRAARG